MDYPGEEPAESAPVIGAGQSLAGAALLIMVGTLVSRFAGLAREQVTANYFGTGDAVAAFTISENVINILLELAATGMLSGALIPVIASIAADSPRNNRELRRATGAMVGLVALVLGPLVVLGMVFAPNVVNLMTALGSSEQERSVATVDTTIELVRIMMPALLFLGMTTVLMATLYALRKPAAPSFSGAVRNVTIILFTLVLADRFGVKGLAIGSLVGSALMLLSQLPALKRADALPTLNLDLQNPYVRRMLRLYAPIFAGLIVSTSMVVIDRNLAWRAQADAIGAMRYATMLAQLLMGLVAAAVSLAVLPRLSTAFSDGDDAAFDRTLSRALAMASFLIIPAVLTMAVLAHPIVDLLFQHGETTPHDADRIVLALLLYLPGHLLATYDQVLIMSFYARQNTLKPVLVGFASAGVYLLVALTLGVTYGMAGLVLANTAQFAFHTLVMFVLGKKEYGPAPFVQLLPALRSSVVVAVATAGVALVAWLIVREAGASSIGEIVQVVVPLTLAGVTYLLAGKRFFGPTLLELKGAVAGKLTPS